MDTHLSAAAQENAVRPEENSAQTWTDSSNVASIFDPPPEFQSSPMFPRSSNPLPQNDLFQNFSDPAPDTFQKSKFSSEFLDVTLDSPDLFRTSQTSALLNGSKSETEDLFAAARSKEVNQSLTDADSLFQPKPAANLFHPEHSGNNDDKENQSLANVQSNDLFTTNSNDKLDLFSPLSSSSSVDPFPSRVTRDIDFSSFEDPFTDSPLKFTDPFQDASLDTSDVFSPVSPKTNGVVDAVKVPPSRPKPPRPVPPVQALEATAPSSDKPKEIVLTTPKGSQHSILQPTPLVQANSQCSSPNQSPTLTHVPTFRRPPKPLPRIRRSQTSVASVASVTSDTTDSSKPTSPDKPPKPQRPAPPARAALATLKYVSEPVEAVPSSDLGPDLDPDLGPHLSPDLSPPKPPPKPAGPKLSPKFPFKAPQLQAPVVRRKHKKTDQVDPENYVVFENILLIGQEQCVEDWPEDSPEVQPDFKPRGTLRLRRESLMARTDSENDDPEAPDGGSKKKEKRFSFSIASRRESKGWSSDECTSRSRTPLSSRKSSREYFTDSPYSSQEIKKDDKDDPEQWGEHKKPHFKDKVNSLLRRASAAASLSDHKHANGNVPREAKDPEFKKSLKDSFRRHSEGTTLEPQSGESGDEAQSKKSKLKNLKLLRNKAFNFSKSSEDESRGAHGFTARKHSQDDSFGHTDYATRKKSMDDGLDLSPSLRSLRADYSEKSKSLDEDEEDSEDEELKKSSKLKMNQSTENLDSQDDHNGEFEFEDVDALKKQGLSPTEANDDGLGVSKPKKTFKLKAFKKHKSKSFEAERDDFSEAASGDFTSEAAQAAFMAAEKDKRSMDDIEDEDADGDTDSLMEWWNTVEQWDEVPSDEEEMTQDDESKSFSVLAEKVDRGLRLFNKVFVERAEVLWQSVITLHAIADDISQFHSKARIAGITGGTTTAIGGATAVAGLVMAPFTFGASLIVTAVGVGVATAGGITSASAAISDNVNNTNDRKKVETLLLENEVHLMELAKILHFSNTGLSKLRGHPFLRSGTQHYAQDWEVRRAVQMIGVVDEPVMKATEFVDEAVSSVQGLFQGMDKYFLKDGTRELKKGCKKEVVAQIKDVASVLNECVVELNGVRDELQGALGEV